MSGSRALMIQGLVQWGFFIGILLLGSSTSPPWRALPSLTMLHLHIRCAPRSRMWSYRLMMVTVLPSIASVWTDSMAFLYSTRPGGGGGAAGRGPAGAGGPAGG